MDEHQSFEQFLGGRLPPLLAFATALVGDPHQAEDVVQDVLVKAHRSWARITRTDRPDLYVRRMVVNEVTSWRRRWHVRTVSTPGADVLTSRATPTPDHATAVVVADDLRGRLSALPPRQRAVLVLRYYEDLDDAEIADVLAVAEGTVRSTASRALAALRVDPSRPPAWAGANPKENQ